MVQGNIPTWKDKYKFWKEVDIIWQDKIQN